MTIAFFTNFINHHQVPLADELYKLTQGNYFFVVTQPIPESFKRSGYPDFSDKPYLVKAYENHEKAKQIARNADVALFDGHEPFKYEIERLKYNRLSFEVSERWFKKGCLNLLSPRLIKSQLYYHLFFYNKPLYKLCSGAFVKQDNSRMLSFINRCYKWGYFPIFEDLDIDKILSDKRNNKIKILWCARFINWKHPELAVKLASVLKKKGYNFEINMYGNGILYEKINKLINLLEVGDVVNLKGNVPNHEIRMQMQTHNIFLFTSDKNEGWGAVANEAMANGCVLVGSHNIGSIPYLIENGKNGCVFKSNNLQSLTKNIEHLFNDRDLIDMYAKNAYISIKEIWSPQNAAKNLLQLIEDIEEKKQESSIIVGPCSKA